MKETHRSAGTNIYETSYGNYDRKSGGYLRDTASGEFGVLCAGNYVLSSARIDMNGRNAPQAAVAKPATSTVSLLQKDMQIITEGQFRYILINTIMPRLPYHEPYTGHSGRVDGLNGSVEQNTNGGLKTGQVIAGQDKPLDLVGSPREGMPAGRYSGQGYDEKGSPIYKFEGNSTDLVSVAGLKASPSLARFITEFESSRADVHPDPKGNLTVGVGHKLTAQDISSNSVLIGGVRVPLSRNLSQPEIQTLLLQDIAAEGETYVRRLVKVPLTQNQFDALCSFTFNIGGGRLASSTLLKELNKGNYADIPNLLMEWTGKPLLRGLVTRREREALLWRGKL